MSRQSCLLRGDPGCAPGRAWDWGLFYRVPNSADELPGVDGRRQPGRLDQDQALGWVVDVHDVHRVLTHVDYIAFTPGINPRPTLKPSCAGAARAMVCCGYAKAGKERKTAKQAWVTPGINPRPTPKTLLRGRRRSNGLLWACKASKLGLTCSCAMPCLTLPNSKDETSSYLATAAVSNRPPLTHSNIVRYCQLSSLPCQRWPPLCVAR